MDKPKIQIRASPQVLIDPAVLRAKQAAETEQKRFEEIAAQILEILKKENVLVDELPRIIQYLTFQINQKIDKSQIEKILKL